MKRDNDRGWPGRMDWRARVLLENADPAVGYTMQKLLTDEAFDVQYCGGPDHLRRHECPLVTEGKCALVEGADVVVHSLNLGRPEQAAVLCRMKEQYPDTPVVVEIPNPAVKAHAELLDGYSVLPMPATRTSLIGALRTALSGA